MQERSDTSHKASTEFGVYIIFFQPCSTQVQIMTLEKSKAVASISTSLEGLRSGWSIQTIANSIRRAYFKN